MKELDLGDKTYFVVDDSLPAVCFRVLDATETRNMIQWAKERLIQDPDAIPRNTWHPVIQHFMLMHI